jgi:hypothetical protein
MSDHIDDAEIALSDLAEIPIAVTVETYRTKVDPYETGKAIAEWDSIAQAAFLTGLADGFTGIGPDYGLQLTYVGMDLAKMPDQAKTRYFLEILASYLKEA